MSFLDRYKGRTAAQIAAAIADLDKEIDGARSELAAHDAARDEAAADASETVTRTWVARRAKLQETLDTKLMRRRPLEAALQDAERREMLAANQARRDDQEKRTAALAKRGLEAEKLMTELAKIFAEFRDDDAACRALNLEKLEGVEPIKSAGERLGKSQNHGWSAFWMAAELPSVHLPYTFHWSMKANPGQGDNRQAAE